jgi:transcription-repair coupling factor (superfamily II helicase)
MADDLEQLSTTALPLGPEGAESDLGFAHPVAAVREALRRGHASTASGLTGAYAAATLTQLLDARPGPMVIVTATLPQGRALAADLEAFGAGRVGHQLLVLPPPDVSPWGDISPDRDRIMERLNAQFRLAMSDDVRAVVLPIEAAMRKVTPWRALEAASTVFSVGEGHVDLERVRSVLTLGGYSNVRLVEDPGTFAIRGGIIDIFSPYDRFPVRIDLWDDEVETIRRFDPQSQRTFEELTEIYVFPVREEILTDEALARARDTLFRVADERHLPSSLVNEILRDLRSGYRFFGVEALLPALFELQSPLALVPEDAAWVLVEPTEIAAEAERVFAQRESEHTRAVADAELALPTRDFYDTPDHVLAQLEARTARLEIGTVGTDAPGAFTFRAHANHDVERLRKVHAETEGTVHALLPLLERWGTVYGRLAFTCQSRGSADRLARLLRGYGEEVVLVEGPLPLDPVVPPPAEALEIYTAEVSSGFRSPALSLALIAERELFGRKTRRTAAHVVEEALAISHFRELVPGDFVVHLDFGIARYDGMESLALDGVTGDYLKLAFAEEDRLYLPIHRLGRVQKYVGGENASPTLDRLGGTRWSKSKAKVRSELKALAEELLRLYAERELRRGFAFTPPSDYFSEFEAAFPFEETPHQEVAISEVIADMLTPKPMDRLVCGDVGFGKTEVAMRAAFLAVLSGKQVAVLVPTTILAEQHGRSFADRFAGTPVVIETLSRFRSAKEQKEITDRLAHGQVDIVIGTHRILSRDIVVPRLGLIIIDEEQRFGVRHKERLKQLKATVDVLTMTATPIPRTLEMSLLGLRDLSIILTPPADRLAVRTYVAQFKDAIVREAIERELHRGGQVFFVHNRVTGIEEIARQIREIVPDARVAVGHAQMSDHDLETVMRRFVSRETDVLVCTTIIESGLDIGSANTILINRADAFGLAQLYQLRGRVGRGRERGYCYLLVPARKKLPQDAARRLEVIRTHTELGSGITIAQHDLDLRGAGNLLGENQSGHIRTVGYDLYCELLEEAIREQRGEEVVEELEPEVKLPVEAYLPKEYLPDEGLRLLFYKRFSLARTNDDLETVYSELVDRFGHPPEEVRRLRAVISLKIILTDLGIEKVEGGPSGIVLKLARQCRLQPGLVVDLVAKHQGRYLLREDMTIIRRLAPREGEDLILATQLVLSDLSKCV